MRHSAQVVDADGEIVYTNNGIIYGKIRWGKLTYYEVNKDIQAVAELDEYLDAGQPSRGVWPIRGRILHGDDVYSNKLTLKSKAALTQF